MQTHTFKHGDIEITVRPKIGQDEIDLPFINIMLCEHVAPGMEIDRIPNRIYVRLMIFSQLICQTKEAVGLPFELPTVYGSDEQIRKAYDTLLGDVTYAPLLQAWVDALRTVNRDPDSAKKKTEASENSLNEG